MYLSFRYPCNVGLVLPDGSMTSCSIVSGEKVKIHDPRTLSLPNLTHHDFELDDGSVLVNVPMSAVQLEPSEC